MDNHSLNSGSTNSKLLISLGILLRLIGFIIVGGILATVLFSVLTGKSIESLQDFISNPGPETKFLLWGLQGISQLFMFIVLPLTYVYFFNKPLYPKFTIKSGNIGIYSIIAVLIIFSTIPLIAWLSEWNKSINLPEFMAGIERWAESKEAAAKKLTDVIVFYSNTTEFFIALLVIAVLPAIGEEIMFRAILQNEFSAVFKNPHVAIWTTGFIFSFIHFQFYGFFPRMLLGVTFGYLYFWSGNIIIPILVHFLNNALTLIAMNLFKQKILDIDPESTESMPFISIIISLIVFSFLLFTFRKLNKKKDDQIDHS